MTEPPASPPAAIPPPAALPDVPLVDNPVAPFLYFDGAPNFGINGGVCNVTLEAMRFTASGKAVVRERITVAHLRMGVAAAASLKDALEKVLLMAQPTSTIPN